MLDKHFMVLRVIEWVILALFQHTRHNFQAEILLFSEAIGPSLDQHDIDVE